MWETFRPQKQRMLADRKIANFEDSQKKLMRPLSIDNPWITHKFPGETQKNKFKNSFIRRFQGLGSISTAFLDFEVPCCTHHGLRATISIENSILNQFWNRESLLEKTGIPIYRYFYPNLLQGPKCATFPRLSAIS